MIFSISFYSFHAFAFNLIYDKEFNKTIIEQSLQNNNHFEDHQKSNTLCLVEHELHKSFLGNSKNDFYSIIFDKKEFYTHFENYLIKTLTNLLKPPTF